MCNVSERTVGEVINAYDGLSSFSLSVLKASVKEALGNSGICFSDIAGLDEVFQNVPWNYLQTGKYFDDNFDYLVSTLYVHSVLHIPV